jgi:fructuronate reductase
LYDGTVANQPARTFDAAFVLTLSGDPVTGGRLSDETVKALPAGVAAPAYDRARVSPGIVHLGVGAFHRAHQAAYVDDCLAAGETGWGIVGASLRSPDTRDALAPQDGLYTLAIRGGAGERLRVVGSILSLLVAPESPAALLDALTDPRTRIVTLTVTEKAYLRAADGTLDAAHPDIVHDLAHPDAPKTVHGFLTEALARRRAARTPPFTVLTCDNLPANGATVRRLMIAFAKLRDGELARHVEEDVAFPSTMIDRIVPATTDADRARVSQSLGVADAWPVMTEPFCQWVVEDHFPQGRPAWEKFGATMVDDVRPYEEMKLRLLNGAHSAIAYLGLLSGHETVDKAFGDPAIRRFVDRLWAEAIPTLPRDAGLDTGGYTAELAQRFANPALAHRTAQIANDGSQKLPQRIVDSALCRLGSGAAADHLALAIAAWIAAGEARGRALPQGHFTDPLDAQLEALAAKALPADDLTREIFDLTGFAAGAPERDALRTLVTDHLARLRAGGPAAAFSALEGKGAAS